MLRERLQAALKTASASGDERAAATLRLVMAALKERDHSARDSGAQERVEDEEILAMLRDMVEQRRQEIGRCESCARVDLAEKEAEEIGILESFLPPRLSEAEIDAAVEEAIRTLGATRLKDCGRVIATLKEQFSDQLDLACAKRIVCRKLH
ncbi:GatB/YqeY domain-containing protein [Geminicoccaceae bacterium 1502E]|nr:GatB/YqeY domain-containing protein [Geminicoccaceae bacterium 1502E]